MSTMCWQETLQTLLTKPNKRLAVVGIGHELRGDDAVGLYIIRELQAQLPPQEYMVLFKAGAVPENMTGVLRRFQPDTVLLIDAVDMGKPPGTPGLFEACDTTHFTASTHTLPLSVFADYLTKEIGCRVLLLGIQPLQLALAKDISTPVQHGANTIIHEFQRAFKAA